jgi:hypothetical protein
MALPAQGQVQNLALCHPLHLYVGGSMAFKERYPGFESCSPLIICAIPDKLTSPILSFLILKMKFLPVSRSHEDQ